jgi:MFS family permease
MSSATSPVTGRVAAPGDRRWLVLIVVAVAQLMVVLDSTIVNIALPSAQRALGFPNSERQWVVTAYALAFAACCWWAAASGTCSAASGSSSPA